MHTQALARQLTEVHQCDAFWILEVLNVITAISLVSMELVEVVLAQYL